MKYRLCLIVLLASPLTFIIGILHTVKNGSWGWAIGFAIAFLIAAVAYFIELCQKP